MSIKPQEENLFEKLAGEGPVSADKLLDEDEILTEADKKKPERTEVTTDGEAKPKKACANCTCGLADELEKEAKEKIKKPDESAAKSSCGSCYLGDAFRCASCPYRGMPAFKPGEKVTIDTTSDDI